MHLFGKCFATKTDQKDGFCLKFCVHTEVSRFKSGTRHSKYLRESEDCFQFVEIKKNIQSVLQQVTTTHTHAHTHAHTPRGLFAWQCKVNAAILCLTAEFFLFIFFLLSLCSYLCNKLETKLSFSSLFSLQRMRHNDFHLSTFNNNLHSFCLFFLGGRGCLTAMNNIQEQH